MAADVTAINGRVAGELSLDDIIAEVDIAPRAVRFMGHVYSVRRDLKGGQIADFWTLLKGKKDVEALSLMVGSDAATLNAQLDGIPQLQMNVAVHYFMEAAGIVAEQGKPGESKAS